MTTQRKGLALALMPALLLAIAAAGCSASSGGGSTASGNQLRIVVPQEPPTLEPCDAMETDVGTIVRQNITQPLVKRDGATGQLTPLLATSWKTDSPSSITVTLRHGVVFSDGTAFDAAAAAFSINRAMNKALGCQIYTEAGFNTNPVTAKAVGTDQVVVTSTKPDPILALQLSFVEMMPTTTSTTNKTRDPIGTGPYELKDWQTGQQIDFQLNPKYWGPTPSYTSVEYRWRAEGSVRANMIKTGEADIANSLAPTDGIGKYAVYYQSDQTAAVRLDGAAAPLNDIRIRQAINYAIDRAALVKALIPDTGVPSGQLAPPSAAGYDPSIQAWPYDLSKAEALVQQAKAAGVPVGTQVTLMVRNQQFPKIDDIAQSLQNSMAQIGLNVKIRTVDQATAVKYQTRPFPTDSGAIALIIEHGNQGGDAQFTVDKYYRSDGAQSTIGTPALDQLISTAEATPSGPARVNAFYQVMQTENQDITQYVFLANLKGIIGLASSVSYTPDANVDNVMPVADMKKK